VTNSFAAKKWSQQLKQVNGSFYEAHLLFLNKLIVKYVYSRLVLNDNEVLYHSLLSCFFYSAGVYKQWEETGETISGIYCIVNIESNLCYIGKSWNIMGRFQEHVSELVAGEHHNMGLQRDFLFYSSSTLSMEVNEVSNFVYPFLLVFLEIGLVSDAQRSIKEIQYIEGWPGLLYNIQYNKEKTVSKSVNAC
jgi:hypothetical protein